MKAPLPLGLGIATLSLTLLSTGIGAELPEPVPNTPANISLSRYFERQVREIELETAEALAGIDSAATWDKTAPVWRKQLAEMLGLDPMPEKTPLHPTKTGEIQGDGYVVENLHYQSLPGLYVTANLYRPAKIEAGQKLPAVLYVCGHSKQKEGDISFGNKTGYHHHGVWFARHGYVCLTIDTIQLGEIEGIHHGTNRLNRWWWLSRGYTPAGVEAWNGIRGIDYLTSRPEVDAERIGVTGRSGGGAYTWWIAALDTRVRAAAPTAGITTLRNHVLDGVVEGHCDCMFHVNTQRWDFDRLASLVAPRPLLILNSDKDRIFPIDGVFSIYQSVRGLYERIDALEHIGLHVSEGPHKDTQPLNTGAFHWFERHLKGADLMDTTDEPAVPSLDRKDLRVFEELPKDERVTRIDESFVPRAQPIDLPKSAESWTTTTDTALKQLRNQVFHGWPADAPVVSMAKQNSIDRDGLQMTIFEIESQPHVELRLYLVHRHGLRPSDLDLVVLNPLDDDGWDAFCSRFKSRFTKLIQGFPSVEADEEAFQQELKMHENFAWGMAYVCPRGVGADAWSGSDRSAIHRERRFNLLGQTSDGMRVWDIRRAIQGMRRISGLEEKPLWLQASGPMGVNALYASLFEEPVTRLDLHDLPTTHESGPAYLNVLKVMDIPEAVALASGRSRCVLYASDEAAWTFPSAVRDALDWKKQFEIRKPPTESEE